MKFIWLSGATPMLRPPLPADIESALALAYQVLHWESGKGIPVTKAEVAFAHALLKCNGREP